MHIWNQTNPSPVYSQVHTVKLRFTFRTFINEYPHKSEVPFKSAFKSPTLLDLISKLFSKIQLTGLLSGKSGHFREIPCKSLPYFIIALPFKIKSLILLYIL